MFTVKAYRISLIRIVWLLALVSSLLVIPASALGQDQPTASQQTNNDRQVIIVMQENRSLGISARSFDTPRRHLSMLCLGCSNVASTPPNLPATQAASTFERGTEVPQSFLDLPWSTSVRLQVQLALHHLLAASRPQSSTCSIIWGPTMDRRSSAWVETPKTCLGGIRMARQILKAYVTA